MTRDEFYILNSLYNGKIGRAGNDGDLWEVAACNNPMAYKSLLNEGYISEDSNITEEGLAALEPYRVKNAIILAAGASAKFIPLSLEKPKGLFEVKDEPLIERQICQLKDAGIDDITVVLGYKKEMFYYLEEKYGVKFVINPSFNVKTNVESIYLARELFANTYLCFCDSYYIENPFNQYEYCSFVTGIKKDNSTEEIFCETDPEGQINKVKDYDGKGLAMMGHTYFTNEFSAAFMELVKSVHKTGAYNHRFWEWLMGDNLGSLPFISCKEFLDGYIFEFDYFEELRQFDTKYLGYTHSNIMRNIKLVFRCDEEDITDFRNISEGLTNRSFIFKIDGTDYIYRHPGEGTDRIINRKNEKRSLISALEAGVDPTYVYMDGNEGWKISKFVHSFREPDYASFEDSKKVIQVLRKLHSSNASVDYGLKPWEDAEDLEKLLVKRGHSFAPEFAPLKESIRQIYEQTIGDGVEKCFCHGDTYKHNWMILPDDRVYLIDWEYSGMSDPGIDVGYYIVDAMYEPNGALRFIKEYLGADFNETKEFHFMAYSAIIAYYWYVWALYRESCGAVIGESLDNWRDMAIKYSDYLLNK